MKRVYKRVSNIDFNHILFKYRSGLRIELRKNKKIEFFKYFLIPAFKIGYEKPNHKYYVLKELL